MGNDCDDYRFYRGLNGVFDPNFNKYRKRSRFLAYNVVLLINVHLLIC